MITNEIRRLGMEQRPWTESTKLRIQRCECQINLLAAKAHSIEEAMQNLRRNFAYD